MRVLLPVVALGLLPGCWPWIPGSPGEYKEVDDTVLYGFVERSDFAGDYWEDNDPFAVAQATVLDEPVEFRWSDVYGDESGCFDTIDSSGITIERADPDIDELTLLGSDDTIELDWVADSLGFGSGLLEGSDLPDHGSRWELQSAMGDDGELRSTTFARLPDAFDFLEPDLNGDTLDTISLSSDLDIAWTDARADYYYVQVYNPQNEAQLVCHTRGTDISVDDRMLTRFSSGDQVYVRVYAIIESRSYLPDYDAMSRTHGSGNLLGVFIAQ